MFKIFFVEVGEVNLRIYLGDEYECPRGHRFFCSGPEKVIKVSSSSTVKVRISVIYLWSNVCKSIDRIQKITMFKTTS